MPKNRWPALNAEDIVTQEMWMNIPALKVVGPERVAVLIFQRFCGVDGQIWPWELLLSGDKG